MTSLDESRALVAQLEAALPGILATRYLSVAGLVILLYDHFLLLQEEIDHIWVARTNWLRSLFFINRYTIPVFIVISNYELSGLSSGLSTDFCRVWIGLVQFLFPVTSAITNVFVVIRVFALWDYNRLVLFLLLSTFISIYVTVIGVGILGALRLAPHLTYQPILNTCIADTRPILNIVTFSMPLIFDILVFAVMVANAFSRPRTRHPAIVRQLFKDGAFYFIMTFVFRLFNILLISVAPISYVQLGIFINWAIIPTLLHRMLVSIGKKTRDAEVVDSNKPESLIELSTFMTLERLNSGTTFTI